MIDLNRQVAQEAEENLLLLASSLTSESDSPPAYPNMSIQERVQVVYARFEAYVEGGFSFPELNKLPSFDSSKPPSIGMPKDSQKPTACSDRISFSEKIQQVDSKKEPTDLEASLMKLKSEWSGKNRREFAAMYKSFANGRNTADLQRIFLEVVEAFLFFLREKQPDKKEIDKTLSAAEKYLASVTVECPKKTLLKSLVSCRKMWGDLPEADVKKRYQLLGTEKGLTPEEKKLVALEAGSAFLFLGNQKMAKKFRDFAEKM